MKKLLILAAAAAVTTTLSLGGLTSAIVESNVGSLDANFVITSINPSENTLTVRYTSPDGNRLGYLNIGTWDEDKGGTEETIDGFLPFFKMSYPVWAYMIYNKYTDTMTTRFNSGEEEKIVLDEMENPLANNKTNKLYYAARVGMTYEYISGKIDYALCVNSAVYQNGVECKAETKEDGVLQYWPYLDGVRLEIPELKPEESEKSDEEGMGGVETIENKSEQVGALGEQSVSKGKSEIKNDGSWMMPKAPNTGVGSL